MAHKTLINGTAYSISGGKTLIDGTAYSIKNGKTLVGGTAYGINFAAATAVITITATSKNVDGRKADITINGTVYDVDSVVASGGTVVLEVPVGTIIECYVAGNVFPSATGYIYVNSNSVATGSGVGMMTPYAYEVVGNTDINMVEENASGGAMAAMVGKIYITEK